MDSEFRIILPDHSGQHIALVQRGGHLALPTFKQESGIRFNTVEKVNAAVTDAWHIVATVARCITAGSAGASPVGANSVPTESDSTPVFAMHNHGPSSGAPREPRALTALQGGSGLPTLLNDVQWVPLHMLDGTGFWQTADGKHVLKWRQGEEEKDWRAIPWSSPTWFDDVSEWIDASVQKRGGKLLAPISQVRVWAISCILKAETSIGNVFLKALPSFWGHEPLLAEYFSKHFPDHSPDVVAIEPDKHWLLTNEWVGKPPDGFRDWQTVLQMLADMQKQCLADKKELLALGCKDRNLELLPSLLEPVSQELQDDEKRKLYGINADEAAELVRRIKHLPELCAKLSECGIHETLLHGDLWGSNVIMKDELSGKAPVIFDWTDAAFTHPFFDLYMLTTAEPDDAKRREELQAHKNVWSAYYAPSVVQRAVECAMQVAPFYYVMAFRTVELNAPHSSRWELAYLLERFVRKILTSEVR